jgi:hypothetical protein
MTVGAEVSGGSQGRSVGLEHSDDEDDGLYQPPPVDNIKAVVAAVPMA